MDKSSAPIVGGTFNDLLTMTSAENDLAPLSLREHMIVFLDDPNSSRPVRVKHVTCCCRPYTFPCSLPFW